MQRDGTPGHLGAVVAVVVLVLLVAPFVINDLVSERGALVLGGGSTGTSNATADTVNATLEAGPLVTTTTAATFFGVDLEDVNVPLSTLQLEGAYLNSTPIGLIRFGGDSDQYDPTTSTYYVAPTGGGTYVADPDQIWNLDWFKEWCAARPGGCLWMASLPGEENESTAAVHYAKWYHSTLGLAPTYWEFGNEPEDWEHYGENITTWSTTDSSAPTANAYAAMVKSYIAAVSADFPSDHYVAIQSDCACSSTFLGKTALVDGGAAASLQFHTYPSDEDSSSSIPNYLALLWSSANVTHQVELARANVLADCASCTSLAIGVGEYNGGPATGGFSPYDAEYPGAVFIAASVIQALRVGAADLTYFSVGDLINQSTADLTPVGLLYQQLLAHLPLGSVYNYTVVAPGIEGVSSLLTQLNGQTALFIVNANVSSPVTLALQGPVYGGSPGYVWSWAASLADPSEWTGDLPATLTVPAEGMAIVGND